MAHYYDFCQSDSDTGDEDRDRFAEITGQDFLNFRKETSTPKPRPIGINLTNCRYDSVRRAVRRCGMKEVEDGDEWVVYWSDTSTSLQRIRAMERYQKINHFPGMNAIYRKDLLARNMNRLLKLFPEEYNIFPRTWSMPADYGAFQDYGRINKGETFICKPGTGSQGTGIFLTHNTKDIKRYDKVVCQQYLGKPFLIDGFKFDLRIYVLVTSCDPLRVYMYKEGIVRFATIDYIEPSHANLKNVFMHLTNYSINKNNKNFIRDDIKGSKRKISTLNSWLENHGYDTVKLWGDIEDVVIKTLISAHPILKHNYRTCFPNHLAGSACFEVLGFDIILDKNLKPWLLEVNHSPSFRTDSCLDREVKDALLEDTLNLINLRASNEAKVTEEDRRQRAKERLFRCTLPKEARFKRLEDNQAACMEQAEKYEDSHLGGYRRVYPSDGTEQYEKFFQQCSSLFQETAASKARKDCARQQLEELRLKEEQKGILNGKNPETTDSIPIPGALAVEKSVACKLTKRPPTCPPNSIKRMEKKAQCTPPLVVRQKAESVSIVPLPKPRNTTTSHANAQAAASRQSYRGFPRLLQSGGGGSLSPQYSAQRHAQQRPVTSHGVQNVRATAAISEPVKPPTRDSQRSLSSNKNTAEHRGTRCKKPSGVSSGSLKNSPHGGRCPDAPRSVFPPVPRGNRSLVAASPTAPITRRKS
ncbi:tubulin polyglutamylase TTLL13-like [Spea bombifrons]|uniref:tubulin polyglutamylase TTLL13-like n=1 Tax=Spea bombifrons TaxID=233779 RepID=UPI00234A5A3E|nr:tubulin polyglutamylase TTLL13-like [Spea bombifrons]